MAQKKKKKTTLLDNLVKDISEASDISSKVVTDKNKSNVSAISKNELSTYLFKVDEMYKNYSNLLSANHELEVKYQLLERKFKDISIKMQNIVVNNKRLNDNSSEIIKNFNDNGYSSWN